MYRVRRTGVRNLSTKYSSRRQALHELGRLPRAPGLRPSSSALSQDYTQSTFGRKMQRAGPTMEIMIS